MYIDLILVIKKKKKKPLKIKFSILFKKYLKQAFGKMKWK